MSQHSGKVSGSELLDKRAWHSMPKHTKSHNSIPEDKREQMGVIDKGQSCPYSGLCQKEEKI